MDSAPPTIIRPVSLWSCRRCNAPLQPRSNFCHNCGIQVRAAPSPAIRKATQILLAIGCTNCIVAWILIAVFTAETVIGTGPILALLGVAIIFLSAQYRYGAGVLIGIAHCFIVVLLVFLVVSLNWSPRAAYAPFLALGGLYIIMILPLSIIAIIKMPQTFVQETNHCEQCGYLLFGLREARCPECGTAFDPSRLQQAVSPIH